MNLGEAGVLGLIDLAPTAITQLLNRSVCSMRYRDMVLPIMSLSPEICLEESQLKRNDSKGSAPTNQAGRRTVRLGITAGLCALGKSMLRSQKSFILFTPRRSA